MLLSLDPAVGALTGLIILDQALPFAVLIGLIVVILAGIVSSAADITHPDK